MSGPALALAASPRDWPDRLHRFFVDHGGARVRVHLLRADDALVEEYDILLVDDVCSFLTPHLVATVQAAGRAVVGVFDASEFPEGKDRLLEAGISDVVEAGADPEEFLSVLRAAVETAGPTRVAAPPEAARPQAGLVAVAGPPGGTGITEVAVGLASRYARTHGRSVLVDLDPIAPSIAQRLALPLHPNLLAALDGVMHGDAALDRWTVAVAGTGIRSVVGAPVPALHSQVHAHEVGALLDGLAATSAPLVVDAGPGSGTGNLPSASRAVLDRAAAVVAVVAPTPIGVARFLDWVSALTAHRDGLPLLAVVNRAPRSRYRRAELAGEILRSYTPTRIVFAPDDRAVPAAVWQGTTVGRGPFRRACDHLADAIAPALEAG